MNEKIVLSVVKSIDLTIQIQIDLLMDEMKS